MLRLIVAEKTYLKKPHKVREGKDKIILEIQKGRGTIIIDERNEGS